VQYDRSAAAAHDISSFSVVTRLGPSRAKCAPIGLGDFLRCGEFAGYNFKRRGERSDGARRRFYSTRFQARDGERVQAGAPRELGLGEKARQA
jgi:hypothetical protein